MQFSSFKFVRRRDCWGHTKSICHQKLVVSFRLLGFLDYWILLLDPGSTVSNLLSFPWHKYYWGSRGQLSVSICNIGGVYLRRKFRNRYSHSHSIYCAQYLHFNGKTCNIADFFKRFYCKIATNIFPPNFNQINKQGCWLKLFAWPPK